MNLGELIVAVVIAVAAAALICAYDDKGD